MTAIQLANLLMVYTTPSDLGEMDASGQLTLVRAINSGIRDYYREAPPIEKTTTLSITFPAPETVSCEVANDSNIVSNAPFTAEQEGCTIVIEGDENDNEVTASNGLLDAYQGETATRNATLFHDAEQIPAVIERFTNHPEIRGSFQLLPFSDRSSDPSPWVRRERRSAGRPRFYRLENVGISQAGIPARLLRVHPMPDKACTVRVNAELAPKAITLEDLNGLVDLGISDFVAEDIIFPLAAWHLAGTSFLRDGEGLVSLLRENRERAIQSIKLRPRVAAATSFEVGSPEEEILCL